LDSYDDIEIISEEGATHSSTRHQDQSGTGKYLIGRENLPQLSIEVKENNRLVFSEVPEQPVYISGALS